MEINEIGKEILKDGIRRGFFDGDERNLGEMIALIHGELSEALEADRLDLYTRVDIKEINNLSDDKFKEEFLKNIKDTFEDELADTIIRLMELATYKGVDLEAHITAKNRFNNTRGYRHGKKY